MSSPENYQKLMDYALRLLSFKAYSKAQMELKLKRRVKGAAQKSFIELVLKRLEELGYLNDDRLISDYLQYKVPQKPQGQFLFLREMRRRGISIENAKAAWEKSGLKEADLARQCIEVSRKIKSARDKNFIKKKMAYLLSSRGFSSEVIWEVLDKIG